MFKKLLLTTTLLAAALLGTQAWAYVPIAGMVAPEISTAENPIWYAMMSGHFGDTDREDRFMKWDGTTLSTVQLSSAPTTDAQYLWRLESTATDGEVKIVHTTGKAIIVPSTATSQNNTALGMSDSDAAVWVLTTSANSGGTGSNHTLQYALNYTGISGSAFLNAKPGTDYGITIFNAGTHNASGWFFYEGTYTPTYNVTIPTVDNGRVTVTRNSIELSDGVEVATGDVLTITATPDAGYQIETLQVNGVDFTSGSTYTVDGDVEITASFIESGAFTFDDFNEPTFGTGAYSNSDIGNCGVILSVDATGHANNFSFGPFAAGLDQKTDEDYKAMFGYVDDNHHNINAYPGSTVKLDVKIDALWGKFALFMGTDNDNMERKILCGNYDESAANGDDRFDGATLYIGDGWENGKQASGDLPSIEIPEGAEIGSFYLVRMMFFTVNSGDNADNWTFDYDSYREGYHVDFKVTVVREKEYEIPISSQELKPNDSSWSSSFYVSEIRFITEDNNSTQIHEATARESHYLLLDDSKSITVKPGDKFSLQLKTSDDAIHLETFADWNCDKEFVGEFLNDNTSNSEGDATREGSGEWISLVGKHKGRTNDLLDYTQEFTVPSLTEGAVVGKTRIRVKYTDAWHVNETDCETVVAHGPNAAVHKGMVVDIPVNIIVEEEPEFYCTITYESAANGTFVIKNGNTVINNGDQVPDGATLHVEATPNEGYMLDVIKYNDEDIEGTYFTAGDENIKIEVQFTEAPTGYCEHSGSSTSTSDNRYLTSLALDGEDVTNGTISLPTSIMQKAHTIYANCTSSVVDVVAGGTVGITVGVNGDSNQGDWAHGYLYIDYNQDGQFADAEPTANGQNIFNVGTTGIPATGSELVSYSYFGMNDGYNGGDYDTTGARGFDSAGASQDNDGKRGYTGLAESNGGLPDFVIPSSLKANTYRARFKMHWNSLDPCGEIYTGTNTIETNAGHIIDFSIKIAADPTGIEEVENAVELYYNNGNIYTNVEGEILIYDLSGKLVRRAQYAPVAVDDLAGGIYIVRVNDNILKFVK